ncbi:sensor domain-containing diguanylate cyclase [Alkalihalobacillus deserti]|uniref:sensor domain-containing diguanylate cyclase n=1 Tax=Alkalihalobacillus deserti TaxID=2879466 RepID=UPI001D15C3D0|nr:sensor domain-containing diguanylate cyclase [Alkalihalobacillus deserti]
MNKFLSDEYNNVEYQKLLDEVVANVLTRSNLFKPALFFIASNDKILSFYKVGYLPKTLLDVVTHLKREFTSSAAIKYYKDCVQFITSYTKEEFGDKQLFLGVVISQTENIKDVQLLIEGIALGLSIKSSRKENQFIQLDELLYTANYQIEFKKLVEALVNGVLERNFPHPLLVLEKKGERFVLLCSTQKELNKGGSIELTHVKGNEEEGFILAGNTLFEQDGNTYLIFPIQVEDEVISLFMFSFLTKEDANQKKAELEEWICSLIPIFKKGYTFEIAMKDENRRNILMQVTKKFHSTMDIGEVLGEIIEALSLANPCFRVHLLLSQEWKVEETLPIKPFKYGSDSSNRMAENAYVTGQILMDKVVEADSMFLFAPLRGKQGVYGVMEIETEANSYLSKQEIDFIEMLADTGGIALENAEMYQQSRKLINDLQLINETSHQLNLNLRLTDTIDYMTHQIKESFGAEEVGFIIFQANGESVGLDGSSKFFRKESTIQLLDGFIRKMKKEKEPVFIGDADLQKDINLQTYHSILAVPMIHSKKLKGMAVAVHHQPYHFTFDHFKLLQSLIHHSTLALTNSMLHEELEKIVITDHLTRLFSRNYLDECIQESLMNDLLGTFLLLDIDNFKKVNDTFGHQVGDDIIIQVANVLKRNIRDLDIAGRWGGEELAIYLPRMSVDIGSRIAERILQAVELETSPRVTVSIGVSSWKRTDQETSLQSLFKKADQGLYQAKESGKNQVVVIT